MFLVKQIDSEDRKDVIKLATEKWGSPIIVSKGGSHSFEDLPGFIALENGEIIGLITYCIVNDNCEIVSLDSLVEKRGIGTHLINQVIKKAQESICKKVWLITTNDNTYAIRYYQKRGFNLSNIYLNAVNESRKIKPQIPLYGIDNIPILHEIEFEMVL